MIKHDVFLEVCQAYRIYLNDSVGRKFWIILQNLTFSANWWNNY
jgi:hypothetical protein